MNEEELYEKYQSDIRRIEEEREDFIRKERTFEEEREEMLHRCKEDREDLEILLNSWGECQDTGLLLTEFEESFEAEYREYEKREEVLKEEYRTIQAKMSHCEMWFDEERRKLQEEN